MVSVTEQVAKAQCPNCSGAGRFEDIKPNLYLDLECHICHGTGLRWLELSRECRGIQNGWPNGTIDHIVCHKYPNYCDGSGRVPDVTLEKVMWLLPHAISFARRDDKWCCMIWHPDQQEGYGDTSLEAACAALLEAA